MKILIVVDMQNDFISGSLGTPEAKAIVPKVANLIKDSADENTVILFTADTHEKNYLDTLEGKNLPVAHCIRNTEGWSIDPEITNAYIESYDKYHKVKILNGAFNEGIIEKLTFGSVDLQNILYEIDEEVDEIEEITFCGLCTGICVLSNAILAKATFPEVPINVIKDCCACVNAESHDTALAAMQLCQINII